MIKVLQVLSDSNIGGAGAYIANYIKNCDRSKVEPTVLLPRGSKSVKLFEDLDCKIIESDMAPDKSLDFKSIKIIKKHIKEGGYHLVHAHGSASARLAAKGVCKSVFTKHTLSQGGGLVNKLLYRLTGGYAIAVSDVSADNLVKLGFNKKRIYTVLNGVSDMGKADDTLHAECKKSFGFDGNKFVIGCVARFSPEKDYETLIRAAAKLCPKYDRAAFLLCGDGPELERMKQLAKELDVYSDCVFTGMIFDPDRAYHAMDMYCITSKFESYGLSLVEAWSANLPSVTSDAAGFAEISDDGVTSLICKSGDGDAIADAIEKVMTDETLAKTLADNGTARYKEKYDAKTFAQNIEKVYFKICGK